MAQDGTEASTNPTDALDLDRPPRPEPYIPLPPRTRVTSAKQANINLLDGIADDVGTQNSRTRQANTADGGKSSSRMWSQVVDNQDPFFLHCFTTKHNTHVTLTHANREPLISISCGNLGFRKGARGTYEAAFQTSAWVMRRMPEKGCFVEGHDNYITKLEVVLRGFSEGRQAFVQALMGIEGRLVRPKVYKVSDGTRIAIGGPRAPNPRRLG